MKEQLKKIIAKGDIQHQIYILLLALFVIFLSTSKYMTSLVQFLLVIHWLVRGQLKPRLLLFVKSPALLIFSALFLWHIIGLIYTNNISYGWHDIKIKLPLLLLPLVIGTSGKLAPRQLRFVLLLFVASVFVASLVSVSTIFGVFNPEVKDFREASTFISHIRFALFVDMAIFILSFYALQPKTPNKLRGLCFMFAIYFIGFLILSKALTGIVVALIVGILLALRWIITHKGQLVRLLSLVAVLAIPVLVTVYIRSEIKSFYTLKDDLSQLDRETAMGNLYWHDRDNLQLENGYYVGLYWCEKELREAWNGRSQIDYDGKDQKDQEIRYTLIRYMTSLGYRKDAVGISKLNDEDQKLIEEGRANSIYRDKNHFHTRMYELIWQIDVYRKGGNPSGHSLTQRMEYLKTAWAIFLDQAIWGVGTGDVPDAFANKYDEIGTQLEAKWQLRAHNQWLTFGVAFGIVGFVVMLISFFVPGLIMKKFSNYFFLLFIMVAFISMFNEDTLETQAGVAFIAFFYPLFLFSTPDEERT